MLCTNWQKHIPFCKNYGNKPAFWLMCMLCQITWRSFSKVWRVIEWYVDLTDVQGTWQGAGKGGSRSPREQTGARRTHLDGGQHQVHGCTLPWGQAPGLLPCHMLLVGEGTRKSQGQLERDHVIVSRQCQLLASSVFNQSINQSIRLYL